MAIGSANKITIELDPSKVFPLENFIEKNPEATDKVLLANGETISKSELKGDKGDTGERGQRGERGLQGEQGIQGIQGAEGKSAYQIWLDAGNQGSEQDFLNYLRNIESPEPYFEVTLQKIQESNQTTYNYLRSIFRNHKKIIIKEGIYEVDLPGGTNGLSPQSNSHIIFKKKGAKIKVKPNNFNQYSVFDFRGVKDVVIDNLNLEGDKHEHLGTTGEHGMGAYVVNCENITLNNPTITKMWGDGMYIKNANNITINDIHLDDNRRQGITLISCNGLYIDGILIENTSGTEPAYGFNLEPNFNGESALDVKLKRVRFKNNGVGNENRRSFAMAMISTHIVPSEATLTESRFEIEMEDVEVEGDEFMPSAPIDAIYGFLKVNKLTIRNGKNSGLLFLNHQSDNFYSEFTDVKLIDCIDKNGNSQDAPLRFYCTGRGNATKTSGTKNIKISGIQIIATRNAKFKQRAIINSSANSYTDDMKNVVIEDVVVKGYDDLFIAPSGFDKASPDFQLNVDVRNSILPKQSNGTFMHLSHSKTQVQYADNEPEPVFYLRNTLRKTNSEIVIENKAQEMQPLKVVFVGNKADTTILKKYVEGISEEQLSGLRIPYNSYVKMIKTADDRYVVTEMSSNVTGLLEL